MDFVLRNAGIENYGQQVNSDGRALVDSVSLPAITNESAESGESYMIASGFVSLTTTASFSGILYIKNTDSQSKAFRIHHFRVCSGLGASPTSSVQIQVRKSSTAGTLISDANPAAVTNMNTTSSNTLNADVYAASGDGKTLTDGDIITQFINRAPGHSIQHYDGAIIIGRNESFSIEVKPSEAQTLCIELIGYVK